MVASPVASITGIPFTDLDERDLEIYASVNCFLEVRRRREVNADLLTIIGNFLVPFKGEFHIFEHFADGPSPRSMHSVECHLGKASFGNYALGLECLEFGTIRTGFLGRIYQALGLIEAAVKIAADLSDKICRIIRTYHPVTYLDVFIELKHIGN